MTTTTTTTTSAATTTTTTAASTTAVDVAALERLRREVTGPVLGPGAADYDQVRRVWNGAIDRRPAVIVRATSTHDVAAAIRFSRAHGLRLAVRGGGHSIPGFSVCEGGLMLDLQLMKAIDVDPSAGLAHAGPGVLWGELDAATQEHGLAVTGGEVSHTGIAGLTLGGGFGWLKRTLGLACDNLVSAEVVTADGRIVRASEDEHPELFWALRGGGGNFGVVTRFTFRIHPVGPILYGGVVVHPAERAADVLRFVRELSARVPDEVSLMVALVTAPPAPPFPPEVQGRPIAVIGGCYVGPLGEGERALQPVRDFGEPLVDLLGPIPYVALQQMVDDANPHGLQYYVKSEWLGGLPDGVIDDLAAHHASATSPLNQILIHQMGGAVATVPTGATAFTYRDAAFVLTVAGCWTSPDDPAEPHVGWVRSAWAAAQPASLGGAYVNHLDADEGEARIVEAYGRETYARLAAIKAAWDPHNVFCLNQNIRPQG